MDQASFVERLLVLPPDPVRTPDQSGADGPPHTFDEFCQEAIEAIGFDARTVEIMRRNGVIKIEDMELPKGAFRNGGVTEPGSTQEILCDDRLLLLVIDNRTVAARIERRDDLNWTETSTMCFLTEELAAELREKYANRTEQTDNV